REKIFARTRRILTQQLPILENWIAERGSIFEWVPPRAGAIAFVPYRLPISPSALVERVRTEQSVLLVPGDMLGGGRARRFGFGYDAGRLREGLARVARTLDAM